MTIDLEPFDQPEPSGPYSAYPPEVPPAETFGELGHEELLRTATILARRNKRQAATINQMFAELEELREQVGW